MSLCLRPRSLGALLGLLSVPVCALDPRKAITQYVQTGWTSENGLPQTSVNVITQTPDGYLWFGTQEGIVRFDGLHFTTYTRSEGLNAQYVSALAVSPDGSLWIGMHGGVAHRDVDGGFHTYSTADGVFSLNPSSLWRSRDGSLWIGTREHGLSRLENGRFQTYTTKDGLPSDTVSDLIEDREGNLWIATPAGLAHMRDGHFRIYTTRDGLPANDVASVRQTRDGALWIGTMSGGAARWEHGRFTIWSNKNGLPGNDVRAILEDRDGNIWLSVYGEGVARIHDGKVRLYLPHDGLPSSDVACLFEDREGGLWMGMQSAGLLHLRDGRFVNFGVQEGLLDESVNSLVETHDGSIWIGTRQGGLQRLQDGKVSLYGSKEGLTSKFIRGLCEARDGTLWVGTDNGAVHVLKDGRLVGTHKLGAAPVFSIIQDRAGALWFATRGEGLFRYREGRWTQFTRQQGLPSDRISAIREAHEGGLWLATRGGGLARWKEGVVTVYDQRNGLDTDQIMSVYEDGDGVVWMSTLSGLSRLKDGKITNYEGRAGTKGAALDIVEDGHENLWITSNAGVVRLSRHELNAFADGKTRVLHPEEFDSADGMRGRECNFLGTPGALRTRDGRLWFPTTRGVSVIDPNRMPPPSLPPPVWIAQILFDDMPVEESPVRLGPGRGAIQIDYTAVNFEAPERVHFQYMLEGFDKNWVDAGTRRVAYYTNLPPGEYRFRVKAASADGVWNEKGAAVALYLKPYFYQTYWFLSVCVMAAIGVGIGLYRLRMRRLIRHTRELEEAVSARTTALTEALVGLNTAMREVRTSKEAAEAAARAKSEFLANMSHEIRTPLNAVVGMTSLLLDQPELSAESRDFVETVRTSSDALLTIINDILDLSKVESGKLELECRPFRVSRPIEEAFDLLATRAAEKNLELFYSVADGTPLYAAGDITRVRQILVNLVSNAVKFTERGEIVVLVCAHELPGSACELEFQVKDTGIGIPQDRMDRLFRPFSQVDASTTRNYGGTGLGLAISRRLSELMEGRIWAESEPGVGSTFHFTIRAGAAEVLENSEFFAARKAVAGKRALVVCDSATGREVLGGLTGQWGMFTMVASSMEEAFGALQSAPRPDVAILYPEGDCHCATQAGELIRSDAAACEVPLVLMASCAISVRDLGKAGELFAAIVAKPLKPAQLLAALEGVVSPQAAELRRESDQQPVLDRRTADRMPLRILLAEDNVVNQKVALGLLERIGYRADVAGNGREVLAALERQCYDLVLMDVHMPEMDGLETTRQIRRRWSGDERPCIVAVTANALDDDRGKCLECGMDDYISKPMRVKELVAALERAWVMQASMKSEVEEVRSRGIW